MSRTNFATGTSGLLKTNGFSASDVISTGTATGGTAIAWANQSGQVVLTMLDATGARAAADITVTGNSVNAIVSDSTGVTVLLGRKYLSSIYWSTVAALVRVSYQGTIELNKNIFGDCDPNSTTCDYLGTTGRGALLATATEYVVYIPITHSYSTGRHGTETLRHYSKDGALTKVDWALGLGHSLSQQLAINSSGLGALSYSDCSPSKGIFYNGSKLVMSDPAGGCGGSQWLALAGMIPAADGFWFSFSSPGAGQTVPDIGLAKVSNTGAVLSKTVITATPTIADDHPDLVKFEKAMLVRWRTAAEGLDRHYLTRVDLSGARVGSAEAISAATPWPMHSYPNGDVGWAETPTLDRVDVVRIKACQ